MATEPDYKFKSSQIMAALTATRGNLSEAARTLVRETGMSCSRQYVKEACERRPELLAFLDDIRQELLDKAEGNIFEAVHEGDIRMSTLVVERLGKDRGWNRKEEIEVTDPNQTVDRLLAARERAKAARKMAVEDGSLPAEPTETVPSFEERLEARKPVLVEVQKDEEALPLPPSSSALVPVMVPRKRANG